MTKKKLMKFGAGLSLFALLLTMGFSLTAHATGTTQFIIEGYGKDSSSTMYVFVAANTSGVIGSEDRITLPATTYLSENDLRNALTTAIVTYENTTGGYSGVTAGDVLNNKPNVTLFSDISSTPTTLAGYGITNALIVPTDHYPTRSLNTCFQVSSINPAFVNYSVDVSATLSVVTGQSGTVSLKKFTNSSCTTGAQIVQQFTNANTGSLTIGLNLTQTITGTLSGFIPAGTYIELVTQNNTGSPTFTYQSSQEAY